jgi:hypothetical protein
MATDFIDQAIEGLRKTPAKPLVNWAEEHPRLAAWVVLSAGIITLLVIEAWDVGLQPTQWLAIIIATILVAGACIWIVSWEDFEAEEAARQNEVPIKAAAMASASSKTGEKSADSAAKKPTAGKSKSSAKSGSRGKTK